MNSQNEEIISVIDLSPDTKKMILDAMEKFDTLFDSMNQSINGSKITHKAPRVMISAIATNIHKYQNTSDKPLQLTMTQIDELLSNHYQNPKIVQQDLKKHTTKLTNDDAKIMSDIKSGIHDFIDKNKGLLGKEQYSQSLIDIQENYHKSVVHLPAGFSTDKMKASVHKFLEESNLRMQYEDFVKKHPEHQIKNANPSPHSHNLKSAS